MGYSDPRNWYMDLANAEAYDQKTFGIDVAEYRTEFLNRLPAWGWPCEGEWRTVIDLGCGGGRDLLAFLESGTGLSVSGIEYSLALADKARERGLAVQWSDFEYELRRAAAVEAYTAHGFWAMASLLWVKTEANLQTLIESIWSLLADRGVFFLAVPYSEETKVGHDAGKNIPIWLYRYSTWRKLLEDAGFVIEYEVRSNAESNEKEWLNIWAVKDEELG